MTPCPNFIGGEWRTPRQRPDHARLQSLARRGHRRNAHCAARTRSTRPWRPPPPRSPRWADTPPTERARVFFRFKMLLEDAFEELAQSVTREHGKTAAEARGDVRRGIEMVEFACGIPSLLMGEILPNVARGIDCDAIRQPLGVCVGITPFNFPAMVPLWMYPVALVCGNTFVLKPSEKVPLTAIRIAQLLEKAGLPHGRVQHRPRRTRGRRCAADASEGARDFVRRLDAHRALHLRDRHEARQARAVQRRREELRRHHARRRHGPQRARRGRGGVRLRGRTLHGGFDGRGRRRRGETFPAAAHRRDARHHGRPDRHRRANPTWGRSSPRQHADRIARVDRARPQRGRDDCRRRPRREDRRRAQRLFRRRDDPGSTCSPARWFTTRKSSARCST